MTEEVKVRKVLPQDFEAIVELDKVYSEEDAFSIQDIERYYQKNPELIQVAEKEDIIGFIVADAEDKKGHIEMLFVHPNHRGEGVGSKLMDKILGVYERKRIDELFAFVPVKDSKALNLYEERDFKMKAYYLKKYK